MTDNVPTKSVKRTRKTYEERRAQLLTLGIQALSNGPIDGVSVDHIAAAAGVSKSLVFHYFRSTDEFHLGIVSEVSRELLSATVPGAGPASPTTALVEAVTLYVDHVHVNREVFISLLLGQGTGNADVRSVFDRTRSAMAERTAAMVQNFGHSVDDRTQLALHGWIRFAEECTMSWLHEPTITREDLVDLNVAALIALIGK